MPTLSIDYCHTTLYYTRLKNVELASDNYLQTQLRFVPSTCLPSSGENYENGEEKGAKNLSENKDFSCNRLTCTKPYTVKIKLNFKEHNVRHT